MLIFYGTKGFKRTTGNTRQPYHCNNCGTDSAWQLIRVSKWFTLFFIPIIPYSFKEYLTCPRCDYGIQVTKENRDEIMKQVFQEQGYRP